MREALDRKRASPRAVHISRVENVAGFRGEESELLRHYSFSTHKFAVIRGRRDDHNRLRLRSNFVTYALPVGCSLLTRFLIRPFWVSNST
jgi:hypothetical protein